MEVICENQKKEMITQLNLAKGGKQGWDLWGSLGFDPWLQQKKLVQWIIDLPVPAPTPKKRKKEEE